MTAAFMAMFLPGPASAEPVTSRSAPGLARARHPLQPARLPAGPALSLAGLGRRRFPWNGRAGRW